MRQGRNDVRIQRNRFSLINSAKSYLDCIGDTAVYCGSLGRENCYISTKTRSIQMTCTTSISSENKPVYKRPRYHTETGHFVTLIKLQTKDGINM